MSTKAAFNTRRVLEAFTSLGGYLGQAVQTADAISPGEVPEVNLPDEPPDSAAPRLLSVLCDGTRKITLPDDELTADDGTTELNLIVSGDDLLHPALFKLVRVGPKPLTIESKVFTNSEEDEFTVTVTFPEDSAGLYDAKFVNEAGQQDVLNRALRIKRAKDDGDDGREGGGHEVEVVAKTTKKERTAKD